jgi:hypothetical protein
LIRLLLAINFVLFALAYWLYNDPNEEVTNVPMKTYDGVIVDNEGFEKDETNNNTT